MYLYIYFTIISNSEGRDDLPFLYKHLTCYDGNLLNKRTGYAGDPEVEL